ncbi:uncharacterized protein LOC143557964 [Bidens hawaiensis]|uniref:uncharacterized protein LOC143557964 n=1 Tax=Bidens hawaiensis TaxID=980011 RepID=UPI00404A096E
MVKYTTCTLEDKALAWWKSQVKTHGLDEAYLLKWEHLKTLILEEYFPRNELQKLEAELWSLTMIGDDLVGYNDRFNELSTLVHHMVTPEIKMIERYLWGLAPQICGMVTSSNLTTTKSAITLANKLRDDAVRDGLFSKKEYDKKSGEKRKHFGKMSNKSKKPNHRKQETAKVFAANVVEPRVYGGTLPKCSRCPYHHVGRCTQYEKCKKFGHQATTCRVNVTADKNVDRIKQGCYECGDPKHFRKDCPKLKNNQARGRAFVIGASDAHQDPNTITGTLLVNNHYASILFDTSADLSFVSKDFKSFLNTKARKLNQHHTIELADGKLIESDEVVQGCNLFLERHSFSIDLLPVELGSFDIVVGMDWLSKNHAEIVCFEKIIRIPLPNGETLLIHGEKSGAKLQLINCMKARKFLRKGYHAFLAHVVDREPMER